MTATGHPLGTPEDVIARLVHARITAGLSQATVGPPFSPLCVVGVSLKQSPILEKKPVAGSGCARH
jgi:hypothetical protein